MIVRGKDQTRSFRVGLLRAPVVERRQVTKQLDNLTASDVSCRLSQAASAETRTLM
jgi:hypothetical protein